MDIDIYADLDFDLGKKFVELEKKNEELTQEINKLEGTVNVLNEEVSQIKEVNEVLKINISELYKTALAELQRKNRALADTRKELDELIVRRAKQKTDYDQNEYQSLLVDYKKKCAQAIEKDKEISILRAKLEAESKKVEELKKRSESSNSSGYKRGYVDEDSDERAMKRSRYGRQDEKVNEYHDDYKDHRNRNSKDHHDDRYPNRDYRRYHFNSRFRDKRRFHENDRGFHKRRYESHKSRYDNFGSQRNEDYYNERAPIEENAEHCDNTDEGNVELQRKYPSDFNPQKLSRLKENCITDAKNTDWKLNIIEGTTPRDAPKFLEQAEYAWIESKQSQTTKEEILKKYGLPPPPDLKPNRSDLSVITEYIQSEIARAKLNRTDKVVIDVVKTSTELLENFDPKLSYELKNEIQELAAGNNFEKKQNLQENKPNFIQTKNILQDRIFKLPRRKSTTENQNNEKEASEKIPPKQEESNTIPTEVDKNWTDVADLKVFKIPKRRKSIPENITELFEENTVTNKTSTLDLPVSAREKNEIEVKNFQKHNVNKDSLETCESGTTFETLNELDKINVENKFKKAEKNDFMRNWLKQGKTTKHENVSTSGKNIEKLQELYNENDLEKSFEEETITLNYAYEMEEGEVLDSPVKGAQAIKITSENVYIEAVTVQENIVQQIKHESTDTEKVNKVKKSLDLETKTCSERKPDGVPLKSSSKKEIILKRSAINLIENTKVESIPEKEIIPDQKPKEENIPMTSEMKFQTELKKIESDGNLNVIQETPKRPKQSPNTKYKKMFERKTNKCDIKDKSNQKHPKLRIVRLKSDVSKKNKKHNYRVLDITEAAENTETVRSEITESAKLQEDDGYLSSSQKEKEGVEKIVKITPERKKQLEVNQKREENNQECAGKTKEHEETNQKRRERKQEREINPERKEKNQEHKEKYLKVKDKYSKDKEMHSKLEETHSKLEETHPKLEEIHSKFEQRHPKLQQTHSKLEETHGKLEETHGKLEEKHQKHEEKHEKHEKTHSKRGKAHLEHEKIPSGHENIHSELDKTRSEHEKTHSTREKIHSEHEKTHQKFDKTHSEHEKTISKHEKTYFESEKTHSRREKTYSTREKQHAKLEKSNRGAKKSNQKLKAANQKRNETNRILESSHKFDKGDQKIEEWKQKIEERNQQIEESNQENDETNQQSEGINKVDADEELEEAVKSILSRSTEKKHVGTDKLFTAEDMFQQNNTLKHKINILKVEEIDESNKIDVQKILKQVKHSSDNNIILTSNSETETKNTTKIEEALRDYNEKKHVDTRSDSEDNIEIVGYNKNKCGRILPTLCENSLNEEKSSYIEIVRSKSPEMTKSHTEISPQMNQAQKMSGVNKRKGKEPMKINRIVEDRDCTSPTRKDPEINLSKLFEETPRKTSDKSMESLVSENVLQKKFAGKTQMLQGRRVENILSKKRKILEYTFDDKLKCMRSSEHEQTEQEGPPLKMRKDPKTEEFSRNKSHEDDTKKIDVEKATSDQRKSYSTEAVNPNKHFTQEDVAASYRVETIISTENLDTSKRVFRENTQMEQTLTVAEFPKCFDDNPTMKNEPSSSLDMQGNPETLAQNMCNTERRFKKPVNPRRRYSLVKDTKPVEETTSTVEQQTICSQPPQDLSRVFEETTQQLSKLFEGTTQNSPKKKMRGRKSISPQKDVTTATGFSSEIQEKTPEQMGIDLIPATKPKRGPGRPRKIIQANKPTEKDSLDNDPSKFTRVTRSYGKNDATPKKQERNKKEVKVQEKQKFELKITPKRSSPLVFSESELDSDSSRSDAAESSDSACNSSSSSSMSSTSTTESAQGGNSPPVRLMKSPGRAMSLAKTPVRGTKSRTPTSKATKSPVRATNSMFSPLKTPLRGTQIMLSPKNPTTNIPVSTEASSVVLQFLPLSRNAQVLEPTTNQLPVVLLNAISPMKYPSFLTSPSPAINPTTNSPVVNPTEGASSLTATCGKQSTITKKDLLLHTTRALDFSISPTRASPAKAKLSSSKKPTCEEKSTSTSKSLLTKELFLVVTPITATDENAVKSETDEIKSTSEITATSEDITEKSKSTTATSKTTPPHISTTSSKIITTSSPKAKMHLPTVAMPQAVARTSKVIASTSKATATTGKAIAPTFRATESSYEAVATTSKGVVTTYKEIATTSKEVATTSKEVATTSKGVSTTSKGVSTASEATETSKTLVKTSKGAKTTSQGVETTSKPSPTTSRTTAGISEAVLKTSKGVSTTSKESTKISRSAGTSSQVAETSNKAAETINEVAETTNIVAKTKNKAIETTNKATETINKTTETISKAIETINKATETINKATETTSEVVETTNKAAEITSQAATKISHAATTSKVSTKLSTRKHETTFSPESRETKSSPTTSNSSKTPSPEATTSTHIKSQGISPESKSSTTTCQRSVTTSKEEEIPEGSVTKTSRVSEEGRTTSQPIVTTSQLKATTSRASPVHSGTISTTSQVTLIKSQTTTTTTQVVTSHANVTTSHANVTTSHGNATTSQVTTSISQSTTASEVSLTTSNEPTKSSQVHETTSQTSETTSKAVPTGGTSQATSTAEKTATNAAPPSVKPRRRRCVITIS